ncbi:MAG: IscS subfamily cysteine desulfurase [Candidatus Wallbacteria bacterium]|nr:IscS subfamily cysteine desulfurase [Candidatus Wallbacteria bacterium]
MKLPVYMDNHATTLVDPAVLEAMLPYFREHFGNAASRTHAFGWTADEAVEKARAQVARLVGASAREIVFTSGATESNNLALKGVAEAYRTVGDHIVTVSTEHRSVLDVCRRLAEQGARVTVLDVDGAGLIDPDEVRRALTERTILVSVMAANNEVGVLGAIGQIGALCRERGVLFHTDATQAAGKVALDVEADCIDLMSLSGHKMYGPKGVGALFVRRSRPRVKLAPLLDGGGHERGMRSGTLNVPGIVGMGKAAELAGELRELESARLTVLRDRLFRGICEKLDGVTLNGDAVRRLPGNLNISFASIDSEALISALHDVAVSSGSACTSATLEPSHVLRAMGMEDRRIHSSIRFGLGRFNTEEEVEHVIRRVVDSVRSLRAMAPGHVPAATVAGPSHAGDTGED